MNKIKYPHPKTKVITNGTTPKTLFAKTIDAIKNEFDTKQDELEHRFESEILNGQSQMTDASAQISAVQASCQANAETIASNTANITANKTSIDTLQTNLQTAQTDISNLQTSVQTNTQNIASNKEKIDTNSENLTVALGNALVNKVNIQKQSEQISALQNDKQNKLTAGENILIDDATNTISATAKTYTAGQNIAIDENNVISATIDTSALQPKLTAGQNIPIDENNVISSTAISAEQSQKLEKAYQYYLTHVVSHDNAYQPKTYSDFPAGTIVQTYDCLDQQIYQTYNNGTNSLTLPTAYFLAEVGSEAAIKIKIGFTNKKDETIEALFTTYVNGESVAQKTAKILTSDQQQSIEIEILGQALNTESIANNICVTVGFKAYSHEVLFENLKFEIFAPNAEFINKYNPFDVECLDGKYYISDCSNNQAKLCTIATNDIGNIETLQFANLGISAPKLMASNTTKLYGEDYTLDDTVYTYQQNNYLYVYSTKNNKTRIIYSPSEFFDALTVRDAGLVMTLLKHTTNKTREVYVYSVLQDTSYYYNVSNVVPENVVRLYGSRYMGDLTKFNYNNSFRTYGCVDPTGKFTLYSTATFQSTATFSIEKCLSPRIYITSFASTSDFVVEIYYKNFEKILKCVVKRTSSGFEQVGETTELGTYQDFFLGNNNDYFVVKNKKLEYHNFSE